MPDKVPEWAERAARTALKRMKKPGPHECGACSFNPTSLSDYCDAHRPGNEVKYLTGHILREFGSENLRRLEKYPEMVKALRAADDGIGAWVRYAAALEQLLACYRLGKRPSDKLLDAVGQEREAAHKAEALSRAALAGEPEE